MKKYILYTGLILIIVVLSGCSLNSGSSSKTIGGVMMSVDSGNNWEIKDTIDEEKNISAVDVLSVVIDPIDSEKIYLGTKSKGILISENSAETWKKFNFPATNNVYGIIVDNFNSNIIYASGVVGGRGKIFKTQDNGENWDEIYTEPADGTYVTSMAMNTNNSKNIFVGTSDGVILKTSDGGKSWSNLYATSGAVSDIVFSESVGSDIYFLIYKKEILTASNNGNNFKKIGANSEDLKNSTVFSIDLARGSSGAIYIGTDKGLFRSNDQGSTFEGIDIIASSKKFPIRAIAINPTNSNEIIYSAAQAVYKSSDSGQKWSTFQLNTTKSISDIEFNESDANVVFAGFRDFK